MTKPSRVHDRSDLVHALTLLTADQGRSRRFLEGLSTNELHYIAEFFGATALDPELRPRKGRAAMARRVQMFHEKSDRSGETPSFSASHKMILLLEFLSLNEVEHKAMAAHVGAA